MMRSLVLSLAVLLGLGIAAFARFGEITGEWDTTITITPVASNVADFFDFETELTVNYIVGGWTFTSYSKLDDTGWVAQTFLADGAFGVFGVDSTLVFDTTGLFTSLDLGFGYTFGAMAIDIDVTLVPGDLTLVFGVTASTGLSDIASTLTFGDAGVAGCDLNWTGAVIAIDFPLCRAEVTASIELDCDGFVIACFDVAGVEIPNLPWVTVGAEVCFELETKSLTLSPSFTFGDDACFVLYIDQHYSGGGVNNADPGVLLLEDFEISGISLECEIGGVSFVGISYWGADPKPSILAGKPYWEAYQVSTTDTACCGDFDFDVAVFFAEAGTMLFDVAALDANFSYALEDNVTFSMGLDYAAAAPGPTLWSIGLEVTW